MTGKARQRRLLAVLVFVAAALFLRTYFVHSQVFVDGRVNFQEADPWYHVRAIEHLTHNFPHRIQHDPFALHPGGQYVPVGPLFDLLVAAASLMVVGGRTTPEITRVVCAWAPAILGALIPIPVYFLGRRLRDVTCGLVAGCLVAILPGPFLQRSLLGFTDHHVAECLFSLLAVWLLIEAHERAGLPLRHARRSEASPVGVRPHAAEILRFAQNDRQRLLGATLAGLSLGGYLLSWVGGALLAAVLCIAITAFAFSEHMRRRSGSRAAGLGALTMAVAGALVLPYAGVHPHKFHLAAAGGTATFLLLLAGLAHVTRRNAWPRIVLLPGAMLLALAGLAALSWAVPGIMNEAARELRRFTGGSAGEFVVEATSLFFADGRFTWKPAYETFATTLITGSLGLVLLVWTAIRHGRAAAVMVAIWSIAILAATLRQQRFAYYMAIPAALLSGNFWSVAFAWGGTFARRLCIPNAVATVAAVGVFATVAVYPCLAIAVGTAASHNGPNRDWHEAMQWLRANSPEPFGTADAYYSAYATSADGNWHPAPSPLPLSLREGDGSHTLGEGERRKTPGAIADVSVPPGQWPSLQATSGTTPAPEPYGILCWWDHGYWVTTLAHRIPTANPTQAGAIETARFLIAQDEPAAVAEIAKLGAKYVVLDATLPVWRSESTNELIGKFGAIVRWTGGLELDYYEPYLLPVAKDQFQVVVLYYPSFYRSMLSRLYLFGAGEYRPAGGTWLVRYSEIPHKSGGHVKRIDDTLQFPNYEAAKQYQESAPGKWRIVGLSFEESCVPLSPLARFRPVYSSPTTVAEAAGRPISHVRIFEFDFGLDDAK